MCLAAAAAAAVVWGRSHAISQGPGLALPPSLPCPFSAAEQWWRGGARGGVGSSLRHPGVTGVFVARFLVLAEINLMV